MTLRGKSDPDWSALVEKWKAEQLRLCERMILAPLEPLPRFVAGADCAFSDDKQTIFAAAVVYDREMQRIIEVARASRPAEFPYVPGFLSFREGPAIKQAIRSLKHEFGAILFDGQGFAHPRRCGFASHLGLALDLPTIGCAKSILIGRHGPLGRRRGAVARAAALRVGLAHRPVPAGRVAPGLPHLS
jgi:deoxyribonuclease V